MVDASYACANDVIKAFAKITKVDDVETDESKDNEVEPKKVKPTPKPHPLHASVIEKIRSSMYTKHGEE